MAMATAAHYGQPGLERQVNIAGKILQSDWCYYISGGGHLQL